MRGNPFARAALAAMAAMFRSRASTRHPFPDTSKATTPPATPRTPRRRIPWRWFYSPIGQTAYAPKGYAFNGRGDLINLAKRERAHAGR